MRANIIIMLAGAHVAMALPTPPKLNVDIELIYEPEPTPSYEDIRHLFAGLLDEI